jgi:hypothetical protein
VSVVEHLLGYVRGQLASGGSIHGLESHGIAPAILRLSLLGIHLRAAKPSPARTFEIAGEALSEVARLLAVEAELGAGQVVELFREAAGRPKELPEPDLRAARADLSVALDHALDLGRAVLDLAGGEVRADRSLIDSAAGAAGRVLAAAHKAAAFPPDPSSASHPGQASHAAAGRF